MAESPFFPDAAHLTSCDGDRPLRTTHNVPLHSGDIQYQHAQYLAIHGWDRAESQRRERELMALIYAAAK